MALRYDMCRFYDGPMRSSTSLVSMAMVLGGLIGCGSMMPTESRGVMRKQLAGTSSVVFTNASPDKMCGLYMSNDRNGKFGDNWLPREGLASGKSIEVKVKPGKYQATWNTCKTIGKPYFAATLTQETAFAVGEPTQLFAFVADTVAPTKRAAVRDFHKMIKFQGQAIGPYNAQQQHVVLVASPAAPAEPEVEAVVTRVDLSAFCEKQPARKTTATASKGPIKASLKRTHDITSDRVGYAERRR